MNNRNNSSYDGRAGQMMSGGGGHSDGGQFQGLLDEGRFREQQQPNMDHRQNFNNPQQGAGGGNSNSSNNYHFNNPQNSNNSFGGAPPAAVSMGQNQFQHQPQSMDYDRSTGNNPERQSRFDQGPSFAGGGGQPHQQQHQGFGSGGFSHPLGGVNQGFQSNFGGSGQQQQQQDMMEAMSQYGNPQQQQQRPGLMGMAPNSSMGGGGSISGFRSEF